MQSQILPVELLDSILAEYQEITNRLFTVYTALLEGKRVDVDFDQLETSLHDLKSRAHSAEEECKSRIDWKLTLKDKHHQKAYKEFERTTKQLQGATLAILSLIQKLKQAESQLESCLRSIDKKVEVIRSADQAPLDYDTLLSYAHRIAPYTSAAPDWNNKFQPYSKPPVPTESDIRKSLLMMITQGMKVEDLYQQPLVEENKLDKSTMELTVEHNAMAPTNANTDQVLDLDL